MAAQQFLVKLTPFNVPENIYVATVLDPNAHPEHPIYYPPGIWGPPDMPPGFWGGGMGPGVKPQPPAGAHPEHPIVIPPQPPSDAHPEHPIVLPPEVDCPPNQGRWFYTERFGWVYIYRGGDKPRPPGER